MCVHVETCTTAFPCVSTGDDENITVGGVEKSLERFMYCFSLEELSKAASCIRFEIVA